MIKFVAEIGCNHNGSFERAKALAQTSALMGADVVKFQKRTVTRETLGPIFDEPYLSPHSYGATYGLHRQALELTQQQHAELKALVETAGAEYSCSVWDPQAAADILELQPAHIKIPSARHTDLDLLGLVATKAEDIGATLHLSLGAGNYETRKQARAIASTSAAPLVCYNATACYPCAPQNVCLNRPFYMDGFSSHSEPHITLAAVAIGYTWIEHHVTLCRTGQGSDHCFSLLPSEIATLKSQCSDAKWALTTRPDDALQCEEQARRKLGK